MTTIDEIKQQAEAVKNATQVGENTAERVGGALSGLADIAKQQDDNIDKKADKAAMDVELGKKADKETVDTELETKVDKEDGKSLIDAEVADSYSVIDNPEFMEVETDSDGKVLAGTYSDGSHYAHNMKSETIDELADKIKEIETNLNNKNAKVLITVGDSLSARNIYQKYLSEMSGIVFDDNTNTSNVFPLSIGGTESFPDGQGNGQQRCLNIQKQHITPDYILYQNYNDRRRTNIWNKAHGSSYDYEGTIKDSPFMLSQIINVYTSGDIDESTIDNYWNTNKRNILDSVKDRKKGTLLSIPYNLSKETGVLIEITGTAKRNGTLQIFIGSVPMNITVTSNMSVVQIVDACCEYNYGNGWSLTRISDSSFKVTYYTETEIKVTVSENGTGITYNLSPAKAQAIYSLGFYGDSAEEWYNDEYWKTSFTLYSVYKGIVEYLTSTYPKARVMFFIPFAFGWLYEDPNNLNSDGTINVEKAKEDLDWQAYSRLREIQIEVCKYYNINYIDGFLKSDINICNMPTYFYNGDVHPRKEGFLRWAEYIYKFLK
nr:MAG TPA: hydrolase [Caudoviricetes sp.]